MNRIPTSRRRLSARRWGWLFTAAASVVLLLAGCAPVTEEVAEAPRASGALRYPPGAATITEKEPPPDVGDCDGTVSLRPELPLPEAGEMPPGSTMESIQRRGRLVVGLDIGSAPLSFRDPISGEIQGFDVDIAQAIAESIFGDPSRVEFRVLDPGDRIAALQRGEVDLVVKSMSITCDRLERVDFSAPYYLASQRILAHRNSGINAVDDLADKRVCSATGSTSVGRIQQLQPAAVVIGTQSWADCLVMMQQGQIDAVVSEDAILAGLAAQDPWLQVMGPSLGVEYYGVAMPKGTEDLVRFVNGVLVEVKADGRWQNSYDRWLSNLGPGSGPPAVTYRD